MPTKTWTLRQIAVGGTNPNRLFWDGNPTGIAAATTSTSGWTVAKTAVNNYGLMNAGVEATTFSTTVVPAATSPTAEINYPATATYAPPRLLNSSDSIATMYPYNGKFPAGNWTFSFPVQAVSSGGDQDGSVAMRVFKATSGAFATNNSYWITYSPVLKLYVMVGSSGMIKTSHDGINWYVQYTSTTADLWGVAWGMQWSGSAYTQHMFVACGASGAIWTSPDGVAWVYSNVGVAQTLYSVVHNGSNWVCVGNSGTIVSAEQADYPNWTVVPGPNYDLYSVVCVDENYIAGGLNASAVYLFSDIMEGTGLTATINFGNGVFIDHFILGEFSTTPRVLAVGSAGWIAWSDNYGSTWTSVDTGNYNYLGGCWDGTKFVLVGRTTATETGKIVTLVFNTTNTYTLTEVLTDTVRIEGVDYNSATGKFVAVGDSNRVYTSTNGTSWTMQNIPIELTTAVQLGTTVTNLATTAAQTSTVTWAAPEVTLNNEHLVCALAWRITGAGGANSRDVLLRYGTGSAMTTPNAKKRSYNTN